MTTRTISIYSIFRPASWAAELPLLLSFNLLLVACSYISINLPFSPVPITGQSFGVLLIAMAIGRVRGTAVVMAYLIEGALGLPVFAGGSAGIAKFFGPTGGFLLGFPLAAWLVGTLADRGWDRNYFRSAAAMTIGTGLIFIAGLSWLSQFVPSASLLTLGLVPFMPGAVIKISVAAIVLPTLWRFVGRAS
ncbi:MAG: biotin transporter BioY [bacterium]|nr:biotin transporter BioY [bacterium]